MVTELLSHLVTVLLEVIVGKCWKSFSHGWSPIITERRE